MFEDALLESAHKIRSRSKYWSVVALILNTGALAALVIWPLLHPEALPTQVMASLLVAPAPPPPPSPVQTVARVQTRPQSLSNQIASPTRIAHATTITTDADEMRPAVDSTLLAQAISDGSTPLNGVIGQMRSGGATVHAGSAASRPVISSGVMTGNLIAKTTPQYPAIAREARIQGTVVLQATIGKAGEIENLRVISGPPMLQAAAVDAVRSWRYKPYTLNGEAVAVETTINVVFSLGN